MARIYMGTQAWGTVWDTAGNALPNQSVQIKNRDGTAATHYSARTGGTSSTASMTTDSSGRLTRYVDPGEYILTVGGTDYDIEAASGTASGGGGSLPSGGTVGHVLTNTAPGTGTWQAPDVTDADVATAAASAASSAVTTHTADTSSVHGVTDTAGLPYVLTWDGVSNYSPSGLRGNTERPKEFRGPTDPDGLTGVVFGSYDTWIDTTP